MMKQAAIRRPVSIRFTKERSYGFNATGFINGLSAIDAENLKRSAESIKRAIAEARSKANPR